MLATDICFYGHTHTGISFPHLDQSSGICEANLAALASATRFGPIIVSIALPGTLKSNLPRFPQFFLHLASSFACHWPSLATLPFFGQTSSNPILIILPSFLSLAWLVFVPQSSWRSTENPARSRVLPAPAYLSLIAIEESPWKAPALLAIMGSLRFSDFGDSPAMVVPPHQLSFDPMASYHSSLQQYHSLKPPVPIDPSQNTQLKHPVGPGSNKKRKRDSFDDESATTLSSHQLPSSVAESPTNSMIFDKGQALFPATSVSVPCATAGENVGPALITSSKSDAISTRRKFRRRENPDTSSLTTINNTIVTSNPNTHTQAPAIDQFTHLLGVGWTRISSNPDPDYQKAIRGWEKYIENHYALTGVAVLATSKALDGAFLTLARDHENMALRRFLLFKEDLSEARLIASDWGTCLMRLQSCPVTFEGDDGEVLRAAPTPDLTPTSNGNEMAGLAALLPLPVDDAMDDVMLCD